MILVSVIVRVVHEHLDRAGLDSPDIPRAFHDRLALLLVRTGDRVAVRGHEALEQQLGLSGRDYTALAVISEDSPSSQSELAKLIGKAPAMCVGMLDEMEESGLVARGRDPKDRRRSVVTLTAKGTEMLAKADALAAEIEAQVIQGLSARERERLLELLIGVASAPVPEPAEAGA